MCVFLNYTVSKAFLLLMNKHGSVGAFRHFGHPSVNLSGLESSVFANFPWFRVHKKLHFSQAVGLLGTVGFKFLFFLISVCVLAEPTALLRNSKKKSQEGVQEMTNSPFFNSKGW